MFREYLGLRAVAIFARAGNRRAAKSDTNDVWINFGEIKDGVRRG